MGHDEQLAQLVRKAIPIDVETMEKPMFGGIVFLIRGNAAVGVVDDDLIVRAAPSRYEETVQRPHTAPLTYLERNVKDWVAVERAGLHDLGVLAAWISEGVSFARSLPPCPRYAAFPDLRDQVIAALRPGMWILDVGAGATPTIEPSKRPAGVHYVGLDISREELERASAGSYDDIRVCSALEIAPELVGKFDVVVTLQTLEHIRPLDDAIDNLRSYLKPGGSFFGQMTGTFTYFSLVNRIIPTALKNAALRLLHHRSADDIFPAYYHHCWHSALKRMFTTWREVDIEPYYTGGGYLTFSDLVFRLYLSYENWVERNDHRNLASHYIVRAVR